MRNKFLTFIFAWFFGAGQMYLGYMKRGTTIMGLFVGTIFVSAFTGMDAVLVLLPIIYAFAFFDTFNLARLTPEERAQTPDSLLFGVDKLAAKFSVEGLYEKRHKWIGWALIALGAVMCYNNFIYPALWSFYRTYEMEWLARVINGIPTLAIALALLYFGIHILRGVPKAKKEDDIVEFTNGGKHD